MTKRSGSTKPLELRVWMGNIGGALDTHSDFIQVELIDDPTAIAESWATARSEGSSLVCRRCGDPGLSIAAILVVPAGGETRLALCARCLLELP